MRSRSDRRSSSCPARYARRSSTPAPSRTSSPQRSSTRTPRARRSAFTAPEGATTATTSPLRIRGGLRIAGAVTLGPGIAAHPRQVKFHGLANLGFRAISVPMRPSPAQIQRVAEALTQRLIAAQALEPETTEQAIHERFATVLARNFAEEEEIEREAEAEAAKLVRQGAPGVRREDLDLRRVEQLVKRRIAQARGFAL